MPDRNNNMTQREINLVKRRGGHAHEDQDATFNKVDFDDQKGWTSLSQFLLTKLKMTTVVKILVASVIGLLIIANVLCAPVLYLFPEIMSHMIFQHYIYVPFKNLSNMHAYELYDAYTFRLAHDSVELGAWHVLPDNTPLQPSENKEHHFELNLVRKPDEKNIVVLYLHGNTNDRSTWHRVGLYKVFRSMGYHVVAIDYRGYGDSTGSPTETDVVRDALFTYEYIKSKAPWATIYIWGHSLGTGVTSHMARILSEQNKPPEGIILEAPFFNIEEEVEFHPFGWVFNWNSIAMNAIRGALDNINLKFRSDVHLTKVTSKIMILHSEDDMVIPVTQAEKLHEVVKKKGKSSNVTFHRFPASLWCGHNHIYWAPNITSIIKNFIH